MSDRPPFRFSRMMTHNLTGGNIVDSKAFSFQLNTIFNQMVTHLLLDFHDSFSKQVKRQKDDKNVHFYSHRLGQIAQQKQKYKTQTTLYLKALSCNVL